MQVKLEGGGDILSWIWVVLAKTPLYMGSLDKFCNIMTWIQDIMDIMIQDDIENSINIFV